MDTYIVNLDSLKPKPKQKVISAVYLGGMYFVVVFCLKLFWPTPRERSGGLTGIAVEAGFMALLWGFGMAYFSRKSVSSYKLLVDDASITGVTEYRGWMKWLVTRRTIRKGKVRTILSLKDGFGAARGIGISERSKWGARMWGWVYVPSNLPEYEYLRQLAEGWRANESTD
jgi:hypothetical protein